MPYETPAKGRGYQKDRFAKEMPRDHGPEVVSEEAEVDLAL